MSGTAQSLYSRIRNRDPAALNQLIAWLGSPVLQLVSMILGQVGRPEDVEETAADVFAAVWQRIESYDPARSAFRTWVLMLAKYTALDRRRQLLRQRYTNNGRIREVLLGPQELATRSDAAEPASSCLDPEEEFLANSRRQRLHRALARMRAPDRELLIRRYFFEESITDLALAHGVSANAIYNRLWRARQALKSLLEEQREVKARDTTAI